MSAAGVAVIGAAGGLLVGGATRFLAGHLRRGAVLPRGSVEILTAVLAAVGGLWLGVQPILWILWWTTAFGVMLAAVDLARHRLPDAITYPVMVLTAALCLAVAPSLAPADTAAALMRSLLAALAAGAAFALMALLAPASMGWGDVKLVVSLGALTGLLSWDALLVALVVAFVAAGMVAVIGILVSGVSSLRGNSRRGNRLPRDSSQGSILRGNSWRGNSSSRSRSPGNSPAAGTDATPAGWNGSTAIAFGPFLIAGAWLSVLFTGIQGVGG